MNIKVKIDKAIKSYLTINIYSKKAKIVYLLMSIYSIKYKLKYYQYYKKYVIYNSIREKYIKKEINNKRNSTQKVKFYLEKRQYNTAKKIIKVDKWYESDDIARLEMSWFVHKKNKIEESNKIFKKINQINNNEKYLIKNISGKSIAVIGPCEKDISDDEIINRHDVIITVNNYIELNNNRIEQYAYYGIRREKRDLDRIRKAYDHVDLISVKGDDNLQYCQDIDVNNKIRKCFQPTNIMYNDYGPNMIPIIAYDLYYNGAERIFLYGVNMYAGKDLYSNKYTKHKRNIKNTPISVRIHEPISNFMFIKNMYLDGFIIPDSVTRNILNMNKHEYVRSLDRNLGTMTVDNYE